MIRQLILCGISLTVFWGCKHPNNKQENRANSTLSIQGPPPASTEYQQLPDSIDIENNKTILLSGSNVNKATVSEEDSTLRVKQNKFQDHRIFGYERPDITSKRMLLISIFTNDVEGNPFNCPYGSYYQTSDMVDMVLKFLSLEKNFIRVNLLQNNQSIDTLYIEKKWVHIPG